MSFKGKALSRFNTVKKAVTYKAIHGEKPAANVISRFTKSNWGKGAVGLGVAWGTGKMIKKAYNWREGVVTGLHPNSRMPMESGRFGTRVSSQPAGVAGLKFNFKRNK